MTDEDEDSIFALSHAIEALSRLGKPVEAHGLGRVLDRVKRDQKTRDETWCALRAFLRLLQPRYPIEERLL
jgi:hypothetical protein